MGGRSPVISDYVMEVYLPLIFFAIALFYSMAGFGGGSSYLAVLALCGLPFLEMKLIALVCNIVVVLNSTVLFRRHKLLKLPKTLPIVLCSIPLAYLGSCIALEEQLFKVILCTCLILAALIMIVKPNFKIHKPKSNFFEGTIGATIGFLSGLVGIGGGVFLSPILNLSAWDTAKSIAATSSLFILVNSIAGLAGLVTQQEINIPYPLLTSLVLAVFLGGQIGVRLGIQQVSKIGFKRITGTLIFIVAVRILLSDVFKY